MSGKIYCIKKWYTCISKYFSSLCCWTCNFTGSLNIAVWGSLWVWPIETHIPKTNFLKAFKSWEYILHLSRTRHIITRVLECMNFPVGEDKFHDQESDMNIFHLTLTVQVRMTMNKQHSQMYVNVDWVLLFCVNGLVVHWVPLHKFDDTDAGII
jgi:hypothetical protein